MVICVSSSSCANDRVGCFVLSAAKFSSRDLTAVGVESVRLKRYNFFQTGLEDSNFAEVFEGLIRRETIPFFNFAN